MSPLRSLFPLFLLLSGLALSAQEIRLSNDYVVDVQVDSRNRIWVGTLGGLNCFDGIETRQFLKQTGDLPANRINALCVDRTEPLVWVALQKAGVACYDLRTERFAYYRAADPENALADDDVTHLVQGPDGDIWMSTFTKGVDRLDRETGKITHYNDSTFPGYTFRSLHEFVLRDDQLVVGYWKSGLSFLSPSNGTFVDFRHDPSDPHSLPGDAVRALLVDSQGRLWVGTTEGLALYQDNSRDFLVFQHREGDPTSLPGRTVYDLKEDGEGNLLVALDGGELASLDIREQGVPLETRPFVKLMIPDLSRNPDIWKVALDQFGNIWVGSYGEGLHFRSHRSARSGRTLLGATESVEVPCLSSTVNGIASCTLDGELIHWTSPDVSRKIATLKLAGRPLCLLRDSDGRWWVGGEDGLRRVQDGREIRVPLWARAAVPVRALLEDGPLLWVGSDLGLDCLDRSSLRLLHHLDRDNGLSDSQVRTLCKDDTGLLWVGTYGHGITVVDPQDLHFVAKYDHNNGLPFDIVNHIIRGSGGRMLVATASGVAVFSSATEPPVKTLSIRDGLVDDDICALAEDAYGRLWMSCNAGISYLDVDGHVHNLDRRDALPDGHYYVGAVVTAPTGRIFFGSSDGLGWVNPAVLSNSVAMPPAEFLQPYREDGWTADYRNNYILARFRVPDFTYSENAEYAYRIADMDSQWIPCGKEIAFNHLPYGKHTLQVRTRHYADAWEDNVSEASLTILPPLWWTWWAQLIYMALAVCALGTFIWWLSRRSVRREQDRLERERLIESRQLGEERMAFYTNMTRDLRGPLSRIMAPLEGLASDASLSDSAREQVDDASRRTRRLMEQVEQLVEYRQTDAGHRQLSVVRGNLSSFVMDTGRRFERLVDKPDLRFVSDIEPDVRLWFDKEAMSIILGNLLTYAGKYTETGEITLSLRREWDRVRICVRDSGRGIPEDVQAHLFDPYYQPEDDAPDSSDTVIGLALVKKLCDLHKIAISLYSRSDQGSEFSLLINPAEQYPDALHPDVAALRS